MKYFYFMIVIFLFFYQTLTSTERWYNDPERNIILQKILRSFGLEKPILLDIPTYNLLGADRDIQNVISQEENDNKVKKYLQIEPTFYEHPLITFRSYDLIKNSFNIINLSLKIDYTFVGGFNEPLTAKIILVVDRNNNKKNQIGNFVFHNHKKIDRRKKITLQIPLNLTVFQNAIPLIEDEIKFLIEFGETAKPRLIEIENVYLEAVVLDNGDRVKRDNDKNCENEFGKNSCCVKKVNINFEEIGWNFIVSPKTFQVQFCHGDCYHASNNMLLGGVINKFKHFQNIQHKSCCYPIEYIPLNVSIFKSGLTVETRTLNNLIAKKCSCY